MKSLTSQLSTLPIQNKRVLVRADLNVTIINDTIVNDYRLHALLPTIKSIQKRGGKVILISHMGRPKNKEPKLSTRQLIPWFAKHGYHLDFAETLEEAHKKSMQNQHTILLLENIRFFPGEKKQDQSFAQQLAQLGDFYVQDAFGVLHRNDTSVALVPKLFDADKRTIGLLVEKELATLNKLIKKPQHPFVLIIGGAKIQSKIPVIEHLLPLIDTVLLCPAIVFTFLKAQGIPVGQSLYNESMLDTCNTILDTARKRNVEIIFPVDYQIARKKITGELSFVNADAIPSDGIGISIGPKTQHIFVEKIKKAQTILFNGTVGFIQRPETLEGLEKIFSAMAQSNGTSIIIGGDSVAAAHIMGFEKRIHHMSTGGGATLTYISEQKLPGLIPFDD